MIPKISGSGDAARLSFLVAFLLSRAQITLALGLLVVVDNLLISSIGIQPIRVKLP